MTPSLRLTSDGEDNHVFLRLWNGIKKISDFPKVATPNERNELRDGIRLEFDPPTLGKYAPGDYWLFSVRAGEISNPEVLINNQPPEGIRYHRVPVAILNWKNSKEIDEIEDCRNVFRPLTNQAICCTITVGDGKSSHGDFDSIEEALRHLPSLGGEICLLPGLHETNASIEGRKNIRIKGCDKQTTVIPREASSREPIFFVGDSECITISNIDMVTLEGTAIKLEARELEKLREIEIFNNRILSYENGISAKLGVKINIHHNKIRMLDKEGAGVAIKILAEDSIIERNDIGVVPAENVPEVRTPGKDIPDPVDICAEPKLAYKTPLFLKAYTSSIWTLFIKFPINPFKALGGIQILGGSERIKVLENEIKGGAGNGITLGGFFPPSDLEQVSEETEHEIEHKGGRIWGTVFGVEGIILQFENVDGFILHATTYSNGEFLTVDEAKSENYKVSITTPDYIIENITSEIKGEFGVFYNIKVSKEEVDLSDFLAFIYDIHIESNSIANMGLSGIGTLKLIPSEALSHSNVPRRLTKLFICGSPIINLNIHRNHISHCLQNPFDTELRQEVLKRGLGGISLNICAFISIRENIIENNGRSHINPVCGIYVAYGEHVDVTLNRIINNGSLLSTIVDDLIPGERGGVLLGTTSFSVIDLIRGTKGDFIIGSAAARVHDNVIEQPLGQALRVGAFGPVSILNNQFKSEFSGPTVLDRFAGSVLIFNLGSRLSLHLPNGNTLFNNNQAIIGPGIRSGFTQMILTRDDLGFDSNQSDSLALESVSVNTFLRGVTLRASDSRFKEIINPKRKNKLSLFSLSDVMNNTTNNQGNHCIIPINILPSRQAIKSGNQVLNEHAPCEQLLKVALSRFRKRRVLIDPRP